MKRNEALSWLKKIKLLLSTPGNQTDLVDLLRKTQEKTIITPETLSMLEGAIIFSQMRARDIMLPARQMIFIQKKDSFGEIIQKVQDCGHSRFPVMDDDMETVIGILHAKDLLHYQYHTEKETLPSFNIIDFCRQTAFIPESKKLDTLLREFRQNRNHMAIVVDEYGSVAGFITIEDIIEQIVGDIEDEFDIEEEPCIRTHLNFHYIIKAHTPIAAFNEQLKATFSNRIYDTIGGIVMNHFGHLPKRGETVHIEGFDFTVLNADSRHIKLLECIDNRPLSQVHLAT